MSKLVKQTELELKEKIMDALGRAVADGVLDEAPLPAFIIEVPKERQNGDYSTNVAMAGAKAFHKAPRVIAQAIVDRLDLADTVFDRAEIAGPGFINFFLGNRFYAAVLEDLMAQCGISEEELQSALEQLKMQAEQNAVQGEASQPDNIIPFEKNMDMAEAPMQPVVEDPIPVIKDRTQAPAQNQNPDANVTEVSQMTEHTEKDSSADEQETDSYQEGQENFNKFQNPAEETTVTPEQDVVPTRTVDTESIMKQLADYVKVRQGSELTEMEMQLHPASLGNVHIQLATKGGVVTAQITTQNEAVKNAIESQVVQLKDNLEEQGVKVEAVEVSVASHEMEKNLDQSGQQQQNEQQNNATGSIQRIRRANINLNLYNSEEEALEEASGLDDAARIAMEMMTANGNTMDLLA